MRRMSRIYCRMLLLMLAIGMLLCSCTTSEEPDFNTEPHTDTTTTPMGVTTEPEEEIFVPVDNISYVELGIPSASRYNNSGDVARSLWDMIVWDGNLYVGSGDYGTNAGPAGIWYYDISKQIWRGGDILLEEEVNRFCVVEDRLIAPGIDPMEGWDAGNYYALGYQRWDTYRNIPGGVHNFDMIAYDGMIFCGLGVISGNYPIACSTDQGRTFASVTMYKNGIPLDTSNSDLIRVYDFFLCNNTLYAILSINLGDDLAFDVYRYENGVFVYDNEWAGKVKKVDLSNVIITGKASFRKYTFFTTGYLYATTDMRNLVPILFPNNEVVVDIYVYEDSLYALCTRMNDNGEYVVSVWKNKASEAKEFVELFNFTYDAIPISLAIDESGAYIGIGNRQIPFEKNGMVLWVEYS